MNKPWKLVLLLVGIFLAGGVTGALVAMKFGRNWGPARTAPDQWPQMHLRQLAQRLELKPEQIDQLKPIIKRNMEELAKLRSESMMGTRAVFEKMEREIAAQLTPEQKTKFDEYNRQMRERMRKFMQKRPGGPAGFGAPGARPEGDRREGPRPPGERPDAPPPGGAPREPGA